MSVFFFFFFFFLSLVKLIYPLVNLHLRYSGTPKDRANFVFGLSSIENNEVGSK